MGIAIIGVIVTLAVSYFYANAMQGIAESKGYEGRVWAWCFWIPVLGGIMVASLPDERMVKLLEEVKENKVAPEQEPKKKLVEPVKPKEAKTRTEVENKTEDKKDTKDTEALEKKVAVVDNGDGTICCPKCGVKQGAGRQLCWSCGQHFTDN